MSATLTWFSSGVGAKTGTTVGALMDDLETLFNSKLGDANFSWRVASKNSAATPFYLVLKRKDGSAGRILIVDWTSAPAGNNAAILSAAPTVNTVYISWFPNGNVDTPSNLTASSGTILGDDTNATKCCSQVNISTIYTTNFQPFYFDSAEAVVIGLTIPGGASVTHGFGAGYLFVDAADNAYGGVIRCATGNAWDNFGAQTSSFWMPWTDQPIVPGSTFAHCIVNYGSGDKFYFPAYAPSGSWGNHAIDSNDVLTDTSLSRAYFVPVPLLGRNKSEGFVVKLRQMAIGPATTSAFTEYATTGPVTRARQFNGKTAGGSGFPWMTNFKI